MTTTETTLRPELEPLPARLRALPVHRGYPVPWFVGWVDGVPEFRAADGRKFVRAVRDKLCWVCGEPLGRFVTFVAGPMCGINRTSAEPPCHLECAEWSARNCPFLSRPHARRRDGDMPGGATLADAPGFAIERNPGVTLLWTCRAYSLFADGKGGALIEMGEPTALAWYAEGKPASRGAVEQSVETGIPLLLAKCDGPADVAELMRRTAWMEHRYPDGTDARG